jgi:receptor protein-tyrosine kinase
MTKIGPVHLVERAAARLREQAHLAALGGQSLADDAPVLVPAQEPAPLPRGSTPPLVLDRARLEAAGLLPATQRRSRIGEELRVAAGNVLRAARGIAAATPGAGSSGSRALEQAASMVLVTSCRAGEGKSFASLNLAAMLAEQGVARVLLIDLDPKRDALSGLLGLENRPGLGELADDAGLNPEQVIVRTAIRDLSVLPMGRQESTGPGVTRGIAMALDRLARRHAGHLILLDAPPCLATSEASSLAPLVSLTVLLVEAERTQRAALERAVDLLKACPNIMLLLNKLHSTRGDDFGGYDYYGV